MPQRKELTWTELRVGVFVLFGLLLIGLGIFYVTGAGVLVTKYRVHTYLPEVEGVTVGAPVRLDGIEIGNVEAIRMNLEPRNRSQNIELILRLDKRYQNEVRTDSYASLITEGLLGNRYVSIKRGLTGTPIQAGGEVAGREETAIKAIVERGADLVQNLGVLSQQVREIVSGVQKGQGTLGKLLKDQEIYNRMRNTLTAAEQIVTSTQAGQGTIGKLVASDELYQKANSAVTRVDTLVADVQAQKGSLGKLIYDPAAYEHAKQFFSRGDVLFSDVEAGKGTLGKLVTDETLYNNMRDAAANINSATAKLNEGRGTAGRFFTDPEFYDNVTGLAGDLRLLLGDFRQNPKKFLRVKFSIF